MKTKFIFILFSFLFISCEKEIPFDDPGTESRIVMGSYISQNDDSITVQLSKSESILSENEFLDLSGASVMAFENGNLVGNLSEVSAGKYSIPFIPSAGKQYQIRVSYDNLPEVSATTVIPLLPQNTEVITSEVQIDDTYPYRMNIQFDDNPNSRDFYQILLIYKQAGVEYDIILSFVTNSEVLRNNEADAGDSEFYHFNNALFSDDLFNGNRVNIPIRSADYLEGDGEIFLRIMKVSEDYYLYRNTAISQFQINGDPFSQPVMIYSNVENGYGVFAGYSYQDFLLEF